MGPSDTSVTSSPRAAFVTFGGSWRALGGPEGPLEVRTQGRDIESWDNIRLEGVEAPGQPLLPVECCGTQDSLSLKCLTNRFLNHRALQGPPLDAWRAPSPRLPPAGTLSSFPGFLGMKSWDPMGRPGGYLPGG